MKCDKTERLDLWNEHKREWVLSGREGVAKGDSGRDGCEFKKINIYL